MPIPMHRPTMYHRPSNVNGLEYAICIGLGDNLVIRVYFDSIKHNYDQIRISHNKNVISSCRNGDVKYKQFLDELGTLLFSEPPYIFDHGNYPEIQRVDTIMNLANKPRKPNLDHLLCKGESLNLDEEYIVITTKIRCLPRSTYNSISSQFWQTMRNLATRYKIVVMGERVVEVSPEYTGQQDTIFGIYDDVIQNVPKDRLIDLTVPALGIVSPDLSKIQQDCLIMKEAKVVITLAIGGNFFLALSVANTICYRVDDDITIDLLSNPDFPTLFATKNFQEFINKLERT